MLKLCTVPKPLPVVVALLALPSLLAPGLAAATPRTADPLPAPAASAMQSSTRFAADTKGQLSLDWHLTTAGGGGRGGALGYAHAFSPHWLIGASFGLDWREGVLSYDRDAFGLLHGELFVRYFPLEYLMLEAGPTVARFEKSDDGCPAGEDCIANFVGLHAVLSVGYRYVFLSTRLRGGVSLLDAQHELGVIYSPLLLRGVIRF